MVCGTKIMLPSAWNIFTLETFMLRLRTVHPVNWGQRSHSGIYGVHLDRNIYNYWVTLNAMGWFSQWSAMSITFDKCSQVAMESLAEWLGSKTYRWSVFFLNFLSSFRIFVNILVKAYRSLGQNIEFWLLKLRNFGQNLKVCHYQIKCNENYPIWLILRTF